MDVSQRRVRCHRAPWCQRDRAVRAGQATLVAAVIAAALLCLPAAAGAARARAAGVPAQLTVTVVPPSGLPAQRPTGGVTLSIDDRPLLTVPLVRALAPLTSITPQLSVALAALGHHVTISYSGDSNYEASDGITVTLPTSGLLTIVARPKDTAAPVIEILAPRDGAAYTRGEAVTATYSCRDPGDRSPVVSCDAPVGSGDALDTSSQGTFSFTVTTADALGNATSRTVTFEVGDGTGGPAGSTPLGTTGSGGPGGGSGPGGSGTGGGGPGGGTGPGGAPSGPGTPGPGGAPGAPPPALMGPVGVASPGAPGALLRAGPGGRRPPTATPAGSPPAQPARPAPSGSTVGPRTPAAPNSGASVVTRAAQPLLASYDPRADPAKTLGILVAAFTLLQLGAGVGGLALAGGAGGVVRGGTRREPGADEPRGRRGSSASKPKPEFGYDRVRVKFLGAGSGTVSIGDRSHTWAWPGTRALDELGAALPARLARRSPLLARVAADGTYLRAILGSASLLGLLAGLALGIAAVRDTGGEALPPAATLTIAIAVLGVLDATAGLLAVLTFMIGVLALGGVQSGAELRVTLTLGVMWFVVPVLVGAVRPLRRPPARSLGESWDRAADFVIASLVGAWTVYQLLHALPGIAGMQLPIAGHAATAAYCVLAALVVRLAAETIAAHLYPRRLDISDAGAVPQPGTFQTIVASALRTALFVFFGYVVAGAGWQLWVAAALFVAPQILAVDRERFPNSPLLFRARPRGLVRLVVLLASATAIAALLLDTMDEHSETFLADSFVILTLPGVVVALMGVFGRRGDRPPVGWGKRIAGTAVLVAGVLLALAAQH
jgi:hypothetical protein